MRWLLMIMFTFSSPSFAGVDMCWSYLSNDPHKLSGAYEQLLTLLESESNFGVIVANMNAFNDPLLLEKRMSINAQKVGEAFDLIRVNFKQALADQSFKETLLSKARERDSSHSKNAGELEGMKNDLLAQKNANITKLPNTGAQIHELYIDPTGEHAHVCQVSFSTRPWTGYIHSIDLKTLKVKKPVSYVNEVGSSQDLHLKANFGSKRGFLSTEEKTPARSVSDTNIGVIDLDTGKQLWNKWITWRDFDGQASLKKPKHSLSQSIKGWVRLGGYDKASVSYDNDKEWIAISADGKFGMRGLSRVVFFSSNDMTKQDSVFLRDSEIQLFSTTNGELVSTATLPGAHMSAIVPISGREQFAVLHLLGGSTKKTFASIFDYSGKGAPVQVSQYEIDSNPEIIHSPSGVIAWKVDDMHLRMKDLLSGRETSFFSPFEVLRFALSDDGSKLATSSSNSQEGVIVDVGTAKQTGWFKTSNESSAQFQFSPDGKKLFSTRWDNTFIHEIIDGAIHPEF